MFRSHRADSTNLTMVARYQQGLAAFETGDYEKAIEHLSGLEQSKTLAESLGWFYLSESHRYLGIAELKAGHNQLAIEHLTKARAINPKSTDLSCFLAAGFAGRGRFDLASAELEREKENSADANRALRLAHAFARDGKMTRAVETLVNAIDQDPGRVDVRFQLGLLYAAAEQYEDAICVFQEATELAPLDANIRQNLGLAHGALEEYSDAVRHLSVAQKLRPRDSYLALLLAMAIDAAKTSCIQLRLVPATGALTTVDDHSVELLGELITQEPDFIEAFLSLPQSQMDGEIFAMLARILERALEHHPDYADLRYHCARVYERMGETEAAIREAQQAIEINPRYVQGLIQLGRLYAETEKSSDAIERLQQAVTFGGDYPDVHFTLGLLYRRAGDDEQACSAFRRALELNSDFAPAQEALEAVVNG